MWEVTVLCWDKHILRGNTNLKTQSFISTPVKTKIKTWEYLWENVFLKHFYHQDELSKEITEHFPWIFYNHFNTWYLNQILRNPCMFVSAFKFYEFNNWDGLICILWSFTINQSSYWIFLNMQHVSQHQNQ